MQGQRETAPGPPPALSVIMPACNEAERIDACLESVLRSEWPDGNPATSVEIIVAANGCTDATVARARGWKARTDARGWHLEVLDLPALGKLGALNAGDAAARGDIRVYLDADVTVSAPLLSQIYGALSRRDAAYASGRVRIAPCSSRASNLYRRIYRRVPFMTRGVPGCGLFAVNSGGRARWSDWPEIISDDTFARLQFRPSERIGVPAGYTWPLVEGFRNLVRVRRRQNAGVEEIQQRFPDLLRNDDKPRMRPVELLQLAFSDPAGFAVYAGVAATVKMTPRAGNNRWSRGR